MSIEQFLKVNNYFLRLKTLPKYDYPPTQKIYNLEIMSIVRGNTLAVEVAGYYNDYLYAIVILKNSEIIQEYAVYRDE